MPGLTVSDKWFLDPRRQSLRDRIGEAVDTTAIAIWRLAFEYHNQHQRLSEELFDAIPHSKDFFEVGLARKAEDGFIYIKGASELWSRGDQ